jgi:hypothetical protein
MENQTVKIGDLIEWLLDHVLKINFRENVIKIGCGWFSTCQITNEEANESL